MQKSRQFRKRWAFRVCHLSERFEAYFTAVAESKRKREGKGVTENITEKQAGVKKGVKCQSRVSKNSQPKAAVLAINFIKSGHVSFSSRKSSRGFFNQA